jgi:O-antigen/teichoic acid export membrane protein
VFGLIFGFGTIGYAWGTFYKARGETRPIAVTGVASVVVFFAVTAPLMLTIGVMGYAIGMASATLAQQVLRGYFLARLFPGFNLLRHAVRALAPIAPAVGAVVLVRLVEAGGPRTLGVAIGELAIYLLIVVAATYAFERPLIREAVGYLRRAVGRDRAAPVHGARVTAT